MAKREWKNLEAVAGNGLLHRRAFLTNEAHLTAERQWEPAADYANYADANLQGVPSASDLHPRNSRNPRLVPPSSCPEPVRNPG